MSARRFSGDRLVIATHNAGKLSEFERLLRPYGGQVSSAASLGLPEPEETADSFAGNAILKAVDAAKSSGFVALADDSGLAVAALDGAPGIYSARWAGPTKDFAAAMTRIEDMLSDNPNRCAAFITVLALAWPDGHCETVEGRVDGVFVSPARGSNGFGYDPAFLPNGYATTFGEMTIEEKLPLSHRGRAFEALIAKHFVF